jgi:hypothetical protein
MASRRALRLIHSEKTKNYNDKLVFACGEYSIEMCGEHIDFFFDLLCDGDAEVAMTASSIIKRAATLIDFNTENVNQWIERLEIGLKNNEENEFIKPVLDWLKM